MEYDITRCEARLAQVRIEVPGEIPECNGSPRDVARCGWSLIRDRADECFLTVAIDARHQPVSDQRFTDGAPNHCGVDISPVARFALMTGAYARA